MFDIPGFTPLKIMEPHTQWNCNSQRLFPKSKKKNEECDEKYLLSVSSQYVDIRHICV